MKPIRVVPHDEEWQHVYAVSSDSFGQDDRPMPLDAPGIPQIVKDFGITIHELLRYALSGITFIAVFYVSLDHEGDRSHVKAFFDSGGPATAALLVIAVGVVAYVTSRRTMMPVVEVLARQSTWLRSSMPIMIALLMLFISCVLSFALDQSRQDWGSRWLPPAIPALLISTIFFKSIGRDKTRQQLLDSIDIDRIKESENKYIFLLARNSTGERSLWHETEQQKFFRQHSEIHVVFVLSLACGFAAGRLWLADQNLTRAWIFLNASVFFWITGFSADNRLFIREAVLLNGAGEEELKKRFDPQFFDRDEELKKQERPSPSG